MLSPEQFQEVLDMIERGQGGGVAPRRYDVCAACPEVNDELYMVHHHIWDEAVQRAGIRTLDQLHFRCLEKILGRQLTMDDFDHDIPVNRCIRIGYELAMRTLG